jgi:hypothetical protein
LSFAYPGTNCHPPTRQVLFDIIDYIIQEHLPFDVQAGVQQFRHYDNAYQAIQTTISQLQEKYMHYLECAMEVHALPRVLNGSIVRP